jgi:two-component system phosphate regulon sensor histidine kinase PhoR
VTATRPRRQQPAHEPCGESDSLLAVLDGLPEGIVAVGADLRVEFANAAALRLLGPLPRGAALPEPWERVSLAQLAQRLFGEEAAAFDVEVESDGLDLSLLGTPAGEAGIAVLRLVESSERGRRERAQRDFVANAAHELRTPLAAIIAVIDVLQGGAKDDPGARDHFLAHLQQHGQRLTRLADALLVLARSQAGMEIPPVCRLRLRPLLERVANEGTPAEGVAVKVRCSADTAALANEELLEQALVNLFANATRHTFAGSITLAASRRGDSVAIEVRDTGTGIPRGERERVLERFYRHASAEPGFGLGLPIAAQAVDAMSGRLELRSTTGRGTVARILLPDAGTGAR